MIVPYFIQFANPSDDSRDNNIDIIYDSSEKCELNRHIINEIVCLMNDFCFSHINIIEITSFDDFCDQYWKHNEIVISGWHNVFNIRYFENGWVEWNIEDFKEEIYAVFKG